MNRREFVATAVTALVCPKPASADAPPPEPMVDVFVQLLRVGTPTDDSRQLLNPYPVVVDALPRLHAVPVVMGWDGPKLGMVCALPDSERGMWSVAFPKGWLCAAINVPKSIADGIASRELVAVPSLMSVYPYVKCGCVSECTRISGAVEVAILPYADGLWNEFRGGYLM